MGEIGSAFLIIIGLTLLIFAIVHCINRVDKAKKVLQSSCPIKNNSSKWVSGQSNIFVENLLIQLNTLQTISDDIAYNKEVIDWLDRKKKACKTLRKTTEAENIQTEIIAISNCLADLSAREKQLIDAYKVVSVNSKDEKIVTVKALVYFSQIEDDALTILLKKPTALKLSNGNRMLFLANYIVLQSNYKIEIRSYSELKLDKSFYEESLGYYKSPASDDEIAHTHWLHERVHGGPDRRFSSNPSYSTVYRGHLDIAFDGMNKGTLSFSNRAKTYEANRLINVVIERASKNEYQVIFKRMMQCEKQCSIQEIRALLESEKIQTKPEIKDNECKKKDIVVSDATSQRKKTPTAKHKTDKVVDNGSVTAIQPKIVPVKKQDISDLLETKVIHKKYGEGVVVLVQRDHIKISFSDKDRLFSYPIVFSVSLKPLDEIAIKIIENDLSRIGKKLAEFDYQPSVNKADKTIVDDNVLKTDDYGGVIEQAENDNGKIYDDASDVITALHMLYAKVIHKKYGEGTVISVQANNIRVRFDDEERLFSYPIAFSLSLKVVDKNIIDTVKKDLNKIGKTPIEFEYKSQHQKNMDSITSDVMVKEDKSVESNIKHEKEEDNLSEVMVTDLDSNIVQLNMYEGALILSGYLHIVNGVNDSSKDGILHSDRANHVIQDLSSLLRDMAIKEGKNIDAEYRNAKMLWWQMHYMQQAFNDSKKDVDSIPKIFFDIVDMYNNNREQFNKLLEDASGLCQLNTNTAEVDKNELVNDDQLMADIEQVQKRQPQFTTQECIILLSGCLRIENGEEESIVVSDISQKLRQRAINNGDTIDDTYRNYAGIRWQMNYMKQALAGEQIYSRPAPVRFKDVVEIYKTSRDSYDKMLDVALASCASHNDKSVIQDSKSIELDLNNYQSEKMHHTVPIFASIRKSKLSNPKSWREVYLFFVRALYNYNHKIINENMGKSLVKAKSPDFSSSVWALRESEVVVKGINVEVNLNVQAILKRLKVLFTLYCIPYGDITIRYSDTGDASNVVNRNALVEVNETENNEVVEEHEIGNMTIDLDDFNKYYYGYSIPVSVSICGVSSKDIKSWKSLYAFIVEQLYHRDSNVIESILDTSITENGGRADFSRNPSCLRAGWEIVNTGIYFETNFNVKAFLRRIKILATMYKIPLDEIVIVYTEGKIGNDDSIGFEIPSQYQSEQVDDDISSTEEALEAKEIKNEKVILTNEEQKIFDVIKSEFATGFKYNIMSYKKIKKVYLQMYSEELTIERDELQAVLDKVCTVFDDKYFVLSELLSGELKYRVHQFIENKLDQDKYVYYQAILDNFGYELLETVPSAEFLRLYLTNNFSEYYYYDNYMSSEYGFKIDVSMQVKSLLKEVGEPMSFGQIRRKLDGIPEDELRSALYCAEIIDTDGHNKFLIDSFGDYIGEDIDQIANIINEAIEENGSMYSKELIDTINRKNPALYDNIKIFGRVGIRKAIEYYLKDSFDFKGNIISRRGEGRDTKDEFERYALSEKHFTVDALDSLAKRIGVNVIYFDTVNEVSSRINDIEYVPKNDLIFDVDGTDDALDRLIEGDMCSIDEASINFALYPSANYPWTKYLLESYAAKYSKKFILIHSCYGKFTCSGAIVRKSSNIKNLNDVVERYLIINADINTKEQALNRLVEDGYLASRACSTIDNILVRAKAQRKE